ncbi:hypothetical protein HMSSN139_01550 [Paenibacillus sp. HMSSN-139]|nr:hypothetical protein HMSSN139_01550 [Paenibacillus sp. HMSSN-139]
MMKDKKWLAGMMICIVVLVYLFIGFARYSGKIGSIVKELQGQPASGESRYHIVLIEQERYHPYWEMVEKGAAEAAENTASTSSSRARCATTWKSS